MKFIVYIVCIFGAFCSKSNSGMMQKKSYFKDFDFINLKGVDSVEKNDSIDLIEVLNEDNKFTIRVHSFKFFTVSNEEIFIKKDNYYKKYNEYKDEDSNKFVKETFYLKDGVGMNFYLSYENNKPDYCKISEINFSKNEIREIVFFEKELQPSPNLTFEKLKNNNDISFINFINISEDSGKLKKMMKRINIKTKDETDYVSYYKGYPDAKINQFWNLYRYYFGKEII